MESGDSNEELNTIPKWDLNPSMNEAKYNKSKEDPHTGSNKIKHQKSFGWEILEGLEEKTEVERPDSYKGIMYRRRKWPMKGWSKFFIVLESGIMAYSKSETSISKRNFDGKIDLGLAIVSYKSRRLRIDIDADRTLFHLKLKDLHEFNIWIEKIQLHRLYRQCELTNNRETTDLTCRPFSPDMIDTPLTIPFSQTLDQFENANTAQVGISSIGTDSSDGVLNCRNRRELVRTFTLVNDEELPANNSSSFVIIHEDFKLVEKKMTELRNLLSLIDGNLRLGMHLSASNPAMNKQLSGSSLRSPDKGHHKKTGSNISAPDTGVHKMAQFRETASELFGILQTVGTKLSQERDNISNTTCSKRDSNCGSRRLFVQLKELNQQNADLRQRLLRIRQDASPAYLMQPQPHPSTMGQGLSDSRLHSVSCEDDSIILSPGAQDSIISKSRNTSTFTTGYSSNEMFYDAIEYQEESDRSSSNSETEEIDETSEPEEDNIPVEASKKRTQTLYQEMTGRRDKLPVPQTAARQISLMNLLCKHIGRDLSKIRLPVNLNEPLSVLQMLCEELEYSDLLDTAAKTTDPVDRMSYLAVFAVSGYASTLHRAGTKPFNPLIGETYEYERRDKGWKFVSEQVSHHPPVSVARCESDSWIWTQEFRLKNKFWGKSIEAIPIGSLCVYFKKFNETVRWNKVTTCIYNIFGQDRYLEHYGDMKFHIDSKAISSHSGQASSPVSGSVTFHKSNWNHEKYEVTGHIVGPPAAASTPTTPPTLSFLSSATVASSNNNNPGGGGPRRARIFGKWTEAIYVGDKASRCVWRPGAMPDDHDQYYGFTQFAIDLNNPAESIRAMIPRTDSRLRPDQRLLELGMIAEAETEKTRVEEKQRERIKEVGGDNEWVPVWFSEAQEGNFVYKGGYWEAKTSHWRGVSLPELW